VAKNHQHIDLWTALLADLDPYQRSRVLKRIHPQNPPSFYSFSKECFAEKASRQTGAGALLLETGLLVRAVTNIAVLTLPEAIELSRLAIAEDPTFDAKLIRYLAGPPRIWPEEVTEEESLHVLAILDQISDGVRLAAPLTKFLTLPYKKVRSKTAKLIARGIRNPGWIEHRRQDTDARVRANVIDGLLQQPVPLSGDMLKVLKDCTHDSSPRVQSACRLLLAKSGDQRSVEELNEMRTHNSPAFRAAADWALRQLPKLEDALESEAVLQR
jgi:hypothetical protein